MRFISFCLFLFMTLMVSAQQREELFDFSFRPNKQSPFYYVVTEKQDTAWHLKAYFISTSAMAIECFYKDESRTILHGLYTLYDINGYRKEAGAYRNGKKDGLWLGYNDKGFIIDSGRYVNGHLQDIRLKWYSDGMPSDSMNFDGAGNGVQVTWYEDGGPASAGYWTQDTLKKGRWKYFFHSGSVMATEEYSNGKLSVCNCFTPKGEAIDTALCREKEAAPNGGATGWRRFLETSLQTIVENLARKGAKAGNYTVVIRFVVLEDGTVAELVPLTKLGQGIEEKVVVAMSKAPKWQPGKQFGRAVKSYHTQPITFSIQ